MQELKEQYDEILINKGIFIAWNKRIDNEKEQIINAYREGRYNESPFIDSNEAEYYYNQTYNQNK